MTGLGDSSHVNFVIRSDGASMCYKEARTVLSEGGGNLLEAGMNDRNVSVRLSEIVFQCGC